MTTFYVVPDPEEYGSWSIKDGRGKVQNAQTQSTAVSNLRSQGKPGKEGDQVVVYGNRNQEIVDSFTIS